MVGDAQHSSDDDGYISVGVNDRARNLFFSRHVQSGMAAVRAITV